ncbi:DUF2865 domain-containing protein [Ensifer soli]|uniref:DUF2865 domain-containing protein n=1 Tax=Ciceribacter sp. sgz301302 TaxID=3342379 RepID=UPI0035B90894
MVRRLSSLLSLALLALLATAETSAALTLCERLERKLASLPETLASTGGAREFTSAISARGIELRRARNERRRLGCGGGSVVVIGGPQAEACREIADEIALMEHNLERLKSRRREAISGGDTGDERRRVVAALEVNRCAEKQVERMEAAAREPETFRNIISDLPPAGMSVPPGGGGVIDLSVPGADQAGPLRTVCVRTCDGAFFPISSQATPADFPRDIAACEARCPGAETELYYHALATEESDDMVSAITGRPYRDMPKAFAYRTAARGSQCGCSLPTLAREHDGEKAPPQATAKTPSVVDVTTATAAVDSEATKPPVVIEERPYDPANSKVRVVGPTYLPTEESKIDLKNPAGPRYQPQQEN